MEEVVVGLLVGMKVLGMEEEGLAVGVCEVLVVDEVRLALVVGVLLALVAVLGAMVVAAVFGLWWPCSLECFVAPPFFSPCPRPGLVLGRGIVLSLRPPTRSATPLVMTR